MDTLQQHVLHVMSGQTPDYLIHPDASAFYAAGINDPEEVEQALNALLETKHVEFVTIETDYERPINIETDDGVKQETEKWTETEFGWTITDKGRKAL